MITRDDFQQRFDVPRGTMAKFDTYAALLTDWQTRMNLVGPATLDDIWGRHFADSAQLSSHIQPGPILDLGSGAGFPGLVLAILGHAPIHLVEATTKKCLFLQTVIDELGLTDVTIHNQRIESIDPFPVANVTARACKNMTVLVTWALPFSSPKTLWLLLKGATVLDEIALARTSFNFEVDLVPSQTDASGRLVLARNLRPVWNR
jgi:16S rRNA (guanine527-N7)-methyltransferase